MSYKRHLQRAIATAKAGPGIGRRGNFKVGAVLYDGPRVLQARFNEYKTHTILSRFSNFPHLHAESSCLIHHGLDQCSDLDLLVVRIGFNDSRLLNSRPCSVCSKLILYSKLRNVYFSNEKGDIEKL